MALGDLCLKPLERWVVALSVNELGTPPVNMVTIHKLHGAAERRTLNTSTEQCRNSYVMA